MKIRPVGAELLHADGETGGRTDRQTDMTKPIVSFRNFAKARKNERKILMTSKGDSKENVRILDN